LEARGSVLGTWGIYLKGVRQGDMEEGRGKREEGRGKREEGRGRN
jgi:hypothetical protein